jgi:hypothetical protein
MKIASRLTQIWRYRVLLWREENRFNLFMSVGFISSVLDWKSRCKNNFRAVGISYIAPLIHR